MPIYKYTGFTADGTETGGTIEAEGLRDAISRLREDGILPRDITTQTPVAGRRPAGGDRTRRLAHVTRQLAILIASGVPLNEALRSLSEEQKGFWRALLVDVREAISSGSSLSKALEAHGKVFPEFYIRMVQAGETGGMLDEVLMRLADYLEHDMAIRARVSQALIYPLFMLSVGVVVLSFVFTFVVPKIVVIFENAKASLPFITVVLLKISWLFRSYWWLMIAMILGSYAAVKRTREKRPEVVDAWLLRLPLAHSLYVSRFTRIFGFLLSGGVPLMTSLDLAARATGNSVLKGVVSEAARRISEGGGIAASLERFPPVLRQMIATGEKTGRLPELLEKAADAYEEDFSRQVGTLLTVMEPAMIVAMGLVVGFIVFAVLLPIFQMNQLIG